MTNGEKYKSLDDRVQAFRQHCADTECPNCCIKPYTGLKRTGCVDRCILKWLNLEAEEVKLLPCPLCGHEASIITDNDKGSFIVDCDACGCQLTRFSREHAIAAWNRRVK